MLGPGLGNYRDLWGRSGAARPLLVRHLYILHDHYRQRSGRRYRRGCVAHLHVLLRCLQLDNLIRRGGRSKWRRSGLTSWRLALREVWLSRSDLRHWHRWRQRSSGCRRGRKATRGWRPLRRRRELLHNDARGLRCSGRALPSLRRTLLADEGRLEHRRLFELAHGRRGRPRSSAGVAVVCLVTRLRLFLVFVLAGPRLRLLRLLALSGCRDCRLAFARLRGLWERSS